MIKIVSKRSKQENILKKYPNAIIADVTSQAKDGLVKLSPFYPHGGIPVPFSDGMTATCVEAVWQGLKVFEGADVDVEMFKNDTMKNIKQKRANTNLQKFGSVTNLQSKEMVEERIKKYGGNSFLFWNIIYFKKI